MIDTQKLNKEMLDLINKEFGLTEDDVAGMDKDKWHELKLKCFDVECREIDAKGECSDYGEVAADIVSLKYKNIKVQE